MYRHITNTHFDLPKELRGTEWANVGNSSGCFKGQTASSAVPMQHVQKCSEQKL